MGRNRRRTYEDVVGIDEHADGIPCAECGCRHSYVVRTVKIGAVIRRTRRCRYCGHEYYTTEALLYL